MWNAFLVLKYPWFFEGRVRCGMFIYFIFATDTLVKGAINELFFN